ncbi:hypothetical protein BC938DRAFT_472546 [Jimgerdemannia flammicorona]|uniref:Uncharacterized protein n=1 Tax=Jimgerdemannia flammicorona TaxID=994334 RepID=A0A433Q5W3_9FUNG|nr:hypothetical protein BC938DRAFT_472546 [Jimgerdemannia flammicorona]
MTDTGGGLIFLLSESCWLPLLFAQQIPNWKFKGSLAMPPNINPARPQSWVEKEILKSIGDMSNHILAKAASKSLVKMKQRYPDYFKRLPLFHLAMQLIGSYHYRFEVRKYIVEMFDIRFDLHQLAVLDAICSDDHDDADTHTDIGDADENGSVEGGAILDGGSPRDVNGENGRIANLPSSAVGSALRLGARRRKRSSVENGYAAIIAASMASENADVGEEEKEPEVPKVKLEPLKVYRGFEF